MDLECTKCKKKYKDIFDTIVRCDYAIPGKGKAYEWHLCMNCRKNLIKYIEPDFNG